MRLNLSDDTNKNPHSAPTGAERSHMGNLDQSLHPEDYDGKFRDDDGNVVEYDPFRFVDLSPDSKD